MTTPDNVISFSRRRPSNVAPSHEPQGWAEKRVDHDRLLSLSNGEVICPDGEDCLSLIEEEAELIGTLTRTHGGMALARQKLEVLIARLHADGHDECEEGQRNLSLLKSALADISGS